MPDADGPMTCVFLAVILNKRIVNSTPVSTDSSHVRERHNHCQRDGIILIVYCTQYILRCWNLDIVVYTMGVYEYKKHFKIRFFDIFEGCMPKNKLRTKIKPIKTFISSGSKNER